MDKKYLAKIIAKDNQGLKLISAFCSGSKIKISNLKYLKKNQIFLVFLERNKKEDKKNQQKINSVCKFEFVENVKSKNINQDDKDLVLELIAIDLMKNSGKFEINLFFNNNSCITLLTEIIEVTLEDQNKI
tara:strand:- start:423 stop:815 length:393 start_codon:yes stop_codon:yes gene_type:complete